VDGKATAFRLTVGSQGIIGDPMVHGGPQAATGHRVGRLPVQGLFDAAILACAMPPRAFGPAPREER
jgi:hypothetical protein